MAESILNTIVADVRTRLSLRRKEFPVSSLEDQPGFHKKNRSLARALRSDRLSIIAEIKRASPSQGVIRQDVNASEIALNYAASGADAISVVTEPTFFDGRLAELALVSSAVDVPVLRKDFIVDPYQIIETKAGGADAVLLIVKILTRNHLQELLSAAHEVGLECLVELYEARELDFVDQDRVQMIGVNNRDLETFEVDPEHASRVLARVPSRIIRVAESGFKTSGDLARAHLSGIDAVLIGETFMRAPDPGNCLAELRAGVDAQTVGNTP